MAQTICKNILFSKVMTLCRLYGSYHALESGKIAKALIDFTGGFDEIIDLTEKLCRPNFTEEIKCILQQASTNKFFIGCSIFSNDESNEK